MSQSQATYGIAITADDKTARGIKSAEKRLGGIPKHVSSVTRRADEQTERSLGRSSRGMLRTLGKVEQASARVFGTRSVTSGLATRLGAVKEAASAAGTGMGEAAIAGGALEGAISAVGVAAAATVGVVAAAGYAAFKLADGWAKGASQIGRTAETIGVATKQLQEFTTAAERVGVDKGTGTAAIAGLSQSLNDARYGRNPEALAVLGRLGVKLQTNSDGTVNVAGMLPAIADALARQNSSGRRTAARYLGIPETALPAFSQGGKALSADMKDADRTSYVASSGEIDRAKRIYRKETIIGQMKDRAIAAAGSGVAAAGESSLDAAVAAGRAGSDGSFGSVVRNGFTPAVRMFERGAEKIAGAVSGMFGGSAAFAAAIQARGEHGHDGQVSPRGARGAMQVMPATAHHPGMGIRPARDESDAEYDRVGHDYAAALLRHYGGDWALASAAYNAGPPAVNRWVKRNGDPRKGEISDRDWIAKIPGHGRGTYEETRRYAERVTAGESIPVHVKVEVADNRSGTKVTATAGRSRRPAISHAMAD